MPRPRPKPQAKSGARADTKYGVNPVPRPGTKRNAKMSHKPDTKAGAGSKTNIESTKRSAAKAAEKAPAKTSVKTLVRAPKPGSSAAPNRKSKPGTQTGERLQKILAAAGIASRRACEAIILEGRVQVNGVTVTELGTRARPGRDEITVDLQPIHREAIVHILVNKPKGYVTTVKDDEGRPTVMALLNGVSARVYPVGRLDFNSEGLLLLTNDGELARLLMDPESHVPKVYLVKIHRMPRPETLDELRGGFRLDGRRLKPCGIEIFEKADNPWLKVTLVEGKNQQIRRMFAAVGHPVSKLKRIQFGPLDDPALKPGEWRFLKTQEVAALKSL
jgi:23S rRNA pseudouridine2605 synthase